MWVRGLESTGSPAEGMASGRRTGAASLGGGVERSSRTTFLPLSRRGRVSSIGVSDGDEEGSGAVEKLPWAREDDGPARSARWSRGEDGPPRWKDEAAGVWCAGGTELRSI